MTDASQEIREELMGGNVVAEHNNQQTCTKLKIVKALHAKAKECTDGHSTVASKPKLNEWFKAISPLDIECLMEIAPGKWAEAGHLLEFGKDAFKEFDGTAVMWPPLEGLIDDDAWQEIEDEVHS